MQLEMLLLIWSGTVRSPWYLSTDSIFLSLSCNSCPISCLSDFLSCHSSICWFLKDLEFTDLVCSEFIYIRFVCVCFCWLILSLVCCKFMWVSVWKITDYPYLFFQCLISILTYVWDNLAKKLLEADVRIAGTKKAMEPPVSVGLE